MSPDRVYLTGDVEIGIGGSTNFNGYYTGAAYTKGNQAAAFTTGSMVATVGSSGGGPDGNNRP